MAFGGLLRQYQKGARYVADRHIRMRSIVLLSSIVMILSPVSSVMAASRYLDTVAGTHDSSGEIGSPWRTLDYVRTHAVSGDTIIIKQADEATYAASWPEHVSYQAKAVKQFGITWQFDAYYPIGKFANGDFWVVGPVTITGITPASTESNGWIKNGSMVNPSPKNDDQGYDNKVGVVSYSEALNVAFNLSEERTLPVAPHSSLVSTISENEPLQRPQIKRAAVLTVLPSAAPAGSFRPPYCGADKTIKFNKSMLDYSLLKRLPPVSGTPSMQEVAECFAAPWLDHKRGWSADYTHPRLNMPNYGKAMHTQIGRGALMLHLDFEPAEKETLLIRYVQLGIDFYGIVAEGGIRNWQGEGGVAGGRKWPILFAGLMLNDPAMKAIGLKSGAYLYSPGYGPGHAPPDYIHFGEDDQTFYVADLDVELTNGPKWIPDPRDDTRVPYTEADIGLPEWGIAHSSKPECSNNISATKYRHIASPPFLGTALAALLMEGGKELWNHNAYFDYTDRYVAMTAEGVAARDKSFIESMWYTYRAQCGPVWPEGGNGSAADGAPILSPIGSKQASVGQVLTFTVGASDPNGDALAYSVTGLPVGATFADRTFAWTPASGDIGSHPVKFTVSDGSLEDFETVTITVSRSNDAPILGSLSDKSVNENQALSFSVSATDTDGDSLAYSATGVPTGATFTGQTFTWTPGYDQAGDYSVIFTVSDGLAQSSQTVAISVANTNRPPVLAEVGDRSVDEDNFLTFALTATDPDGTGLAYSTPGLPAGANLAGSTFTWTPTAEQAGSHEITFVVSDGTLTDSETITVMVVGTTVEDHTAPVVARQSPAPEAIQVALNNLFTLHVTDSGKGVDPASVRITADGEVVYQGNAPEYTSESGRSTRSGSKHDYQFVYQPSQMLAFDHEVVVTVSAADLAGNMMNEYTYSFATEMRTFGNNRRVSTGSAASKQHPATVADAAGNTWAAWHAGQDGARDIFVAKLPAGQDGFETPVRITDDSSDQCNPDLALGADGILYVVWQDRRRGNWDIYATTSPNGSTFSKETLVTDSDDNQIDPAVAVDGQSPSTVHVTWQDDRDGNQDIYVARSTNAFASVTVSKVTANAADQAEPDIAADAAGTAYLVWTDKRNGQADIYGATSAASWANVALITDDGDQTSPVIAVTPGSSILHLLWVDSFSGDPDICHASSNGLPAGPLAGTSIIDDTSGAAQTAPTLACAANGGVFACWRDTRNIGVYGEDSDLYFAELGAGATGTNILIGEHGANANQSEPAIAIGKYNLPYVVWTDDRHAGTEIYCAATTCIDPAPLYSTVVAAGVGATVGTAPEAINEPGDVSVVVPAGACPTDLRVTISQIVNPLISLSDCLGSYDFGPSGVDFDQPVTVTIPFRPAGSSRRARAYWYNSLTGALSQQGITDIENITISPGLYALRFKTTHFTPYYVVADDSAIAISSSDGEGGGGCSISTTGGGSPKHLLVPVDIVVLVMTILRRKDRKRAMDRAES